MITKYDFELILEKVAENFYFNPGGAFGQVRGGNSIGNEVYFGNVAPDIMRKLNCQLIVLPQGECPDSGIFGDFDYKKIDEVNWKLVEKNQIVVFEIEARNEQKRYIEIDANKLQLPSVITPKSEMVFKLNDLDFYGEFFGVEYKASKKSSPNSIAVAPFNSSCPCKTKTIELINVTMIHNHKTTKTKNFAKNENLKVCEINLKIQYSLYYFIVNDRLEGSRSVINHIFLCSGSFFAPDLTEEITSKLSKELKLHDLGYDIELYNMSFRYRPFLGSKNIKAKGYGLYTSWEPKIPREEEVEAQRKVLMDEVEKIPQTKKLKKTTQLSLIKNDEVNNSEENVIFLNLKEEMIRIRSA